MKKKLARVILSGLIALSPILSILIPLMIGVVAPLTAIVLSPFEVKADAVDLYWVGGTATWDATAGTKWATSSGGAGGHAVPTSTNNVFLDAASGVVTITLSAAAVCANLDASNFAGSFSGSSNINVYGSLTLGAANVTNFTGAITFKSTAAGKTITTNGKTITAIAFDGVGGGWQLQDTLTIASSGASFVLTNGTLGTNGKTLNLTGGLNTDGGTLTLGASVINCISVSINAATTVTAGTSNIVIVGTIGSSFAGGGKTFNSVSMSIRETWYISGANTFATLSISSQNIVSTMINFQADQVITGTLTITGYNATTRRLLVYSNTLGTPRQLTAAAVSITNTNLRDMAGTGASSWDISAGKNSDYGGNYGITFTTPQNNYWVGNSGSWSDVNHWALTSGGTGGLGRVSLVQDTAIFDANSITIPSRTITMDMTDVSAINALDVQWTPTFSAASIVMYGSLNLGVVTWNPNITFSNRRAISNISTTSQLLGTITIDNYDQTVKFLNDAVVPNTITLTSGYLDLNDYDITATTFTSTGSLTRGILLGSGMFTLDSTAATTKWTISGTNVSIYGETSTIFMSNSGTSAQTFAGGGITTYNNLKIGGAGNYITTITGTNTFNQFWIDRSVSAKTVKFTASTTQTVSSFSVPLNGSTVVTLQGATSATWTLSKSSGAVNLDWLSITYSTATGGASWYAGANSINVSNNSGWIWGTPAAPTGTTGTATTITKHTANLHGNITSLGAFSSVWVFYEYGLDTGYGYNTAPEEKTVVTAVSQAATGLPANTLIHFRFVIVYAENTTYVYANDSQFTTTATIVEAKASPTAPGAGNPFFVDIPAGIGNMYTEGDFTKVPGADIVNKVLDDSEVPWEVWWYPFIALSTSVIGFTVYGATRLNGGPGSVLLMVIVMVVVLAVWATLGVIPFSIVILFLIPAITWSVKQNMFSW